MYFIVKNLRRQIEIPPDKFGRMINVRMPTVFSILSVFASATTFFRPRLRRALSLLFCRMFWPPSCRELSKGR